MPSWMCQNLSAEDFSLPNETPTGVKLFQKSSLPPQQSLSPQKIDSSLSPTHRPSPECCDPSPDPVHPRIWMKIRRILRPTWDWTVEQVDQAHPTRLIFRRTPSSVLKEVYVVTENGGLTKEDLEEISKRRIADSLEQESVSLPSIPPPSCCITSLSAAPSSLTSETGSITRVSSPTSSDALHPVGKNSPSPKSLQEVSSICPISTPPSAQVHFKNDRDHRERRHRRQIKRLSRALRVAAAAVSAEIKDKKRRRLRPRKLRAIRSNSGCRLGDKFRDELEFQTQFYRHYFLNFCNVSPVNLKRYRIPSGHSGQRGITFNPMDNSETADKKTHYTSSGEETTFCSSEDKFKPKPDSAVAQLWKELVAEKRGQSSSSSSDLVSVKCSSSPTPTPTPQSSSLQCGANDASLFCGEIGSHSSTSPAPNWLTDMSQGWSGAKVSQPMFAPQSSKNDDSGVDFDILIITHDENDVLPMPSPFCSF